MCFHSSIDLQEDPRSSSRRAERRLVRLHESRPILRGGEHVGDRTQRLRLRRVEHEHAAHGGVCTCAVVASAGGARPRQLREKQQRRDFLLDGGRAFRALLEQRAEILPALRTTQQAHEVERGLAVALIDVERLSKVALGLRRLRREPHERLGRRHVEAGREAAIGRCRRFLDVLVGELLPVASGELELGDRFLRHRVVAAQHSSNAARAAGTSSKSPSRTMPFSSSRSTLRSMSPVDASSMSSSFTMMSGRPRSPRSLRAAVNRLALTSGGV
jgi:hypothetical protein